ncbi:glutamine-hydrolyzing GMP synthase [Candidatus Gottesmanbacteria bacterium RIFCSPHIGHO2_02_FULL_40_24]|uniref:GMP synthase [glutamine-hydrolyzing] n=1 Tax=Candidatus Gottesmanbacteria bacterium RIFCSPHIGHO2_01_FULL_40_15 TaxID=1798376 RepID=A0A1F5Z637_9BACT|nr:MAG: glutamine-hydrolyzing GMP synthase [Candidatus Gottesmanbacteria bacterium RIFCSPHIGHO2_01_FULL_40_15]OGG18743.1 MAG: glutamine-hydrolyzing GMP synthase [Candidatus Gottesmanbacteria bacterium RIFCSPHIGHO2_02_FULL_40_24]OGG20903.1 MAG: glutamine-hydrolyzing GMP synthase [Candidatus Gottesmanbacteria bacterium RIFCSPLOWO2_01_FULL_40_10]OGG23034.1 MAG: glutamine-hydrolyzing GMP synthase [Candidatus Gottesmanbacteria bacterium RIFCSPHIGHO2_12_FULL_40_13]OGG32244.1 MAG: glutamine-hydrolyzin
MILIIDFGSQTCHLIGRRIRDMGVPAEIILPDEALKEIKNRQPRGIILSGGPSSVYADNALLIDNKIFNLNIPVMGICYGLQIMGHQLGGKVSPGKKKEYGPTVCRLKTDNRLFNGLPDTIRVWMSHFDTVVKPPLGARVIGSTPHVKIAAVADEEKYFYGVQFHPEVHHTKYGSMILENFVLSICQETPVKIEVKPDELVKGIKEIIGKNKAVCALSGGIDSTVSAVLTYKSIGQNLTCFYVDTGLMRSNETEEIIKNFRNNFKFKLKIIKAENIFLENLKGVTDPEEKRKIIGETFIRVFENNARSLNARYLVQGTIYPDIIESKGTLHADKIKTHHNVGGIPVRHGFTIVEPLRQFYKDEVRLLAGQLKIPETVIHRHVFPGPGLAVRIIGEVTKEKLDILRKADLIVVEEIKKAGLYEKIWMAFAVLTGIKTTGVAGDERKYGETIAVRVIESKDTMTADWVKLPYPLLARISERIVNEVFEVVRVVYDITTKPPATMEWE